MKLAAGMAADAGWPLSATVNVVIDVCARRPRKPIATWSATSASSSMLPTAMDCHHDCRPTKISPALRMPIVATPMAMPSGRPGAAGKRDPAEDHGGEHVELESDADGRRDAAKPPGDQHGDEADQHAVDGVEADDRAPDRDAAQVGGAWVAADRVDAQPRHRAGQDERPDDEDRDRDHHGNWMPRILPRPRLKQRAGKP